MSIQSEINRIKTDKESLITTLQNNGIEITDGATLGDINVTLEEKLPEAGGSGGGNSIETIILTISCNLDLLDGIFISGAFIFPETSQIDIINRGIFQYTLPKNSIIHVLSNTMGISSIGMTAGEYSWIFDDGYENYVYQLHGNSTLEIN